MAKGYKTGGKQKGSKNKSTLQAEAYVKRVVAKLKAEKNLTPENISVELLTCGLPAIVQKELQSLREFIYSKPKQLTETEISGSMQVQVINKVERPTRQS
jgi:hypothetical protein